MTGQYVHASAPARDLKPGDMITFASAYWQVHLVSSIEVPTGPDDSVLLTRIVAEFGHETLDLRLDPDMELNIKRPDPEAELIEQLCKVRYESMGAVSWEHAAAWHKESERAAMRAVLKAINEEGSTS